MKYVFHEPDQVSFDKVGIKGKIFPTTDLTDVIEFVLVDTDRGHETKIIEKESIFAYYVLEGEGFFEIDSEKEECKKGDLIVIPTGKKFVYKGKLKLLLINTPRWTEEQELEFYES